MLKDGVTRGVDLLLIADVDREGDRPAADLRRRLPGCRLVDVGDVDGWRHTLAALLGDARERARLGAAARARIEERNNTRVMWHELAGVLRDRGVVR